MGDRGNLVIVQDGGMAAVYVHWTGYRLPAIAADAVRRVQECGRLNDDSYAARIVLDTVSDAVGSREGGLGMGVSFGGVGVSGDGYPVVTLDFRRGSAGVFIASEDAPLEPIGGVRYSFDEWVMLAGGQGWDVSGRFEPLETLTV